MVVEVLGGVVGGEAVEELPRFGRKASEHCHRFVVFFAGAGCSIANWRASSSRRFQVRDRFRDSSPLAESTTGGRERFARPDPTSSSTRVSASLTSRSPVRRSHEAKNAPFQRRQGSPIIVERVTSGCPSIGSARSQNLRLAGEHRLAHRRSSAGVGTSLRHERIGPEGRAFGSSAEPIEVVRPAAVVGAGGEIVETAVDEPQHGGRLGGGGEVDLDSGRAGWDLDVGSFPAVGEHDPTCRHQLDVLARAGVAVGVGPAHDSTGTGIERGVVGHPLHEQRRVGQQLVQHLRRRVDLELLDDELHDADRFFGRAFARLRAIDSAVARSRCSGAAQNSSRNEAISPTRCRSAR